MLGLVSLQSLQRPLHWLTRRWLSTVLAAHSYSSVPEGCIRLLYPSRQRPGVEYDISNYEIRIVELKNAPSYIAMSYTWEGQFPWRPMCSGPETLFVTTNVKRMMEWWYMNGNMLPLWIDAVCINQEDATEKATQVRLMGEIYQGAERVYIFLSDGPYTGIDDMTEQIMRLSYSLGNEIGALTPEWLGGGNIPGRNWLPWRGIRDLYVNSWFSRVWTMQEAAFASKLEVIFEGMPLEFEEVARLASHLIRLNLVVNLRNPETSYQEQTVENTRLFAATQFAAFLYENKNWDPEKDAKYWRWIHLSRMRGCSEPQDRIFGILGLLPRQIRESVTVDYTIPMATLSEGFFRACIAFSGPFEVLGSVRAIDRMVGSPSWCPNLTVPVSSEGFMFSGRGFAASGDLIYKGGFIEGQRILSIDGFCIDSIKDVVEFPDIVFDVHSSWEEKFKAAGGEDLESKLGLVPWSRRTITTASAALLMDFDSRSLDLARLCYKTEAEAVERHFATLTAAGLPDTCYVYKKWDHWDLEDYSLWKQVYPSNDPPSKLILDCWRGHLIDGLRMNRLMSVISQNLENKSYFSTVNGRVGIGSKLAKPGDLVCILYGGWCPFLLRPGSRKGYYRYLDDTYVDGFMHGEALKFKDEQSIEDVRFHIE